MRRECNAAVGGNYLGSPRHSIKAVVVAAAAIMRILYRGTFVRLVSLCRLIYLADVVVYACFSSEIVSCRLVLSAVALRSHGEKVRRAETVTPGSDCGPRVFFELNLTGQASRRRPPPRCNTRAPLRDAWSTASRPVPVAAPNNS